MNLKLIINRFKLVQLVNVILYIDERNIAPP